MSDTLTVRDLSERCGEGVETLLAWRSLGLIGREGEEAFATDDAERARLVRLLLRRGVDLAAVARTEKQSGFLAGYMRTAFPEGVGRAYSLGEASQLVGLDVELVRRFSEATGLPEQGRPFGEADVDALKAMKVCLEAGFPEDALLQMARVYVDALGRVTEAEARLFHFYVHERLRAQGLSDQALLEASGAAAGRMAPLTDPILLYFHRKGFERAMREEAVLQMQERAGLVVEKTQVPGQLRVAIVFVDLSGFTSLAEAMGDDTAAQVLDRFSQAVREAVSRREGRVVKQIGDAFMLVFPDPCSAVTCALEIDRRATAEPHFPAVRSGVHWGLVLYREGDYLGANVNLAARLAAEAERHQVLVTAAVRKEVGSLPGAEVVPLGKRRLKGLAEELELFAVVPREEGRVRQRLVDPVCGVELDTAEVAARLALAGRERAFCSQQCLQRFVAAPERYAGGTLTPVG